MNAPTSMPKWHPERVVRSDAGSDLWAPVDREGREHGITPSHDRAAMQRLCDRLNNMNAPAFTPGPWQIKERSDGQSPDIYARCAADGSFDDPVCQLYGGPILEVEATARLIAAAPDLYAACRAALRLAWEVGSETEDGVKTLLDDGRGDLYRQLSSALARAGSQS